MITHQNRTELVTSLTASRILTMISNYHLLMTFKVPYRVCFLEGMMPLMFLRLIRNECYQVSPHHTPLKLFQTEKAVVLDISFINRTYSIEEIPGWDSSNFYFFDSYCPPDEYCNSSRLVGFCFSIPFFLKICLSCLYRQSSEISFGTGQSSL